MGCGCKQQPQQPVVPKGITPIQVHTVQSEPVTYTIEQLIRVKEYIISTNKTETERQWVETFMLHHIGLIVPSYCDTLCLSNLRSSVQTMESKLN
jgi:hypothetical protein